MSKRIEFKTITDNLPPGVVMRIEGTSGDSGENINGVYLAKDAWLNAFESERFMDGLKRKCHLMWFGHPEEDEPNPANSCGRLNDAKVLEDGEVWAQFDIVDCPTGRLIANYCKGGTRFGVSERGWGDTPTGEAIGEVDPDTFICNGFDVVQFPAFPNAIPDIVAIASSENPNYRRLLASAKTEIPKIESSAALVALRKLPNSRAINELIDTRLAEVKIESFAQVVVEDTSINDDRLTAVNSALARKTTQLRSSRQDNERLQRRIISSAKQKEEDNNQIAILSAEVEQLSSQNVKLTSELRTALRANRQACVDSGVFDKFKRKSEAEIDEVSAYNAELLTQNEDLLHQIQTLQEAQQKSRTRIAASARDNRNLSSRLDAATTELNETRQNLLSAQRDCQVKARQLQRIQSSVSTTKTKPQTSDEFKTAYLQLLGDAYGVDIASVRINGSATPAQIRSAVDLASTQQRRQASITKINSAVVPNVVIQPQVVDVDETDEEYYANFGD
jgi:hypothetical protein